MGIDGDLSDRHLAWLVARFGQIEWMVIEPEDRAHHQGPILRRLDDALINDRSALVSRLARTCVPGGGWAAYGAERLVVQHHGWSHDEAEWSSLLDASAAFLRSQGVPWRWVPHYLRARMVATGHCPDECIDNWECPHWLPLRDLPEVAITPLVDGERRCVVVCRSGGVLTVVVQAMGPRYAALVDLGSQAELTPSSPDHLILWHIAEELDDLYIEIARGLPLGEVAHPEIEPYFALPRPRI